MSNTIKAICEAYLRHKLKTHKSRHAQILSSLSQSLGAYRPQDVTPKVVAAWRAKRPTLSDSSARRELGALISALRWGARHKMFNVSDLPNIDLPPPGQAKSIWMTLDQEEEFWLHAQDWGHGTRPGCKAVHLFVSLALDTAARKSAILRLTWDRVMLDQGLIDYREPGQAQTNKRRIPVPINRRLKPVLIRAWAAAPKDGRGKATGPVVGSSNIDRAFADFAATVGFEWVTPHICRHTWACLAAQAGMPMFHIAKMLGDTLKTVEENYAHLAPSHLINVADWRWQGVTP
jgi:integrase